MSDELSTTDLTQGGDVMSCPACHHYIPPEYRVWANLDKGVQVRARCPFCLRLWRGILHLVDHQDVYEVADPYGVDT